MNMDLRKIALERLSAGDIKGAEELITLFKKLEEAQKKTEESPGKPKIAAPEKQRRAALTCLQCAGSWQPRTDHPSFCPKCLSRKWNRPVEKIPTWLHCCERCEFEWESKRFRPAICPSCKSGKWHIFKGPSEKDSPSEARHWYRNYKGCTRAQWDEMVDSGRIAREIAAIAVEVKA